MNEPDDVVTPPLRDMGRGIFPQKANNTANAVSNDNMENKRDTIRIHNNNFLPYFKKINSNTTNSKHHNIISAQSNKQVNNKDMGARPTRVYITQSDKYIPPHLRGKYANGKGVRDDNIVDAEEAMEAQRATEGLFQRKDDELNGDVRKTNNNYNEKSNGSRYQDTKSPQTLNELETERVQRSQRYEDEFTTWKQNKAGRRWHNDPLTILGEKMHKCSGGAGGPRKIAHTVGTQVGYKTDKPTKETTIRTQMSINRQTFDTRWQPYMPEPIYIPPHARVEAKHQTVGGVDNRQNNARDTKQAQVADVRSATAKNTQYNSKEIHHALTYEHLDGMDKWKKSKNYLEDAGGLEKIQSQLGPKMGIRKIWK